MRHLIRTIVIGLLVFLSSGCPVKQDKPDAGTDDPWDEVVPEETLAEEALAEVENIPSEFMLADFPLRVPQAHELVCGSGEYAETWELMDRDFICWIVTDEFDITIYLQNTPLECLGYWGNAAGETVGAWVSDDETVAPLDATYYWGGNHGWDWIGFIYGGTYYQVWYSTIFECGWRTCAPPDCLIVCENETPCDAYGTCAENGCLREAGGGPPPLPVICVMVNADGSVPELLDPWTYPEDTPLLPCECDEGSPIADCTAP